MRAYLFDLDGTLVDSQLGFHARAESAVLKEIGIYVKPEEISERFAGIPTKQVFETLAPKCHPTWLVQKKWYAMYKLIATQSLLPMPGMFEICRDLRNSGVPIVIASASPFSWICKCLSEPMRRDNKVSSFGQIFEANFVSAENCKAGKPAPDVFLAAKDSLISTHDAINMNWVVVGDGESDVLGGLAAGMEVLFLSASNSKFDDNNQVQRFADSQQLADFIAYQSLS